MLNPWSPLLQVRCGSQQVTVDYARSFPTKGAPGRPVPPSHPQTSLPSPCPPPPASRGGHLRRGHIPLWRAVPVSRTVAACRSLSHQPDHRRSRFSCAGFVQQLVRPDPAQPPHQHTQSTHHQPQPKPQSSLGTSSHFACVWSARVHSQKEYTRYVA
jgi:hypothetical protein